MSFSSGVFSINSSGQPVVTGTVISSTTFNTLTADLATGLSTCLLKDGTQTVTANIPMSGFKITGLGGFDTGTSASTFTFDGTGGTSGSVTMSYQKAGNFVTLNIPQTSATTGTSSTVFTSNTALPAAIRPAATKQVPVNVINASAASGTNGIINIGTNGILEVYRSNDAQAFSNSDTGGVYPCCITYFIG